MTDGPREREIALAEPQTDTERVIATPNVPHNPRTDLVESALPSLPAAVRSAKRSSARPPQTSSTSSSRI